MNMSYRFQESGNVVNETIKNSNENPDTSYSSQLNRLVDIAVENMSIHVSGTIYLRNVYAYFSELLPTFDKHASCSKERLERFRTGSEHARTRLEQRGTLLERSGNILEQMTRGGGD